MQQTFLVVVRDMGYEAELLGGLTRAQAQSLALDVQAMLLDYGVTKPRVVVVKDTKES